MVSPNCPIPIFSIFCKSHIGGRNTLLFWNSIVRSLAVAKSWYFLECVHEQNGENQPRIKESYQMKKIMVTTLKMPLTLSSRLLTMTFMPGLWLMNLRGLRILSILIIFMKLRSLSGKEISIREKATIMKSSWDQLSRRYVLLSNISPWVIIFITHSKMKNPVIM
jgi:hypothetical protein